MRISYVTYLPDQEIPVYDFVVQRKLVKYYTRETMAAMAAMAALYPDRKLDEDTPFFYATGELGDDGFLHRSLPENGRPPYPLLSGIIPERTGSPDFPPHPVQTDAQHDSVLCIY